MKEVVAVLFFLLLSLCAYSQSTTGGSQFDAAVEAYESGEYERTISLLAAYEKANGTSPRLESLRALTYRDLEKPKEAHQAVLVYLRLTAGRNMSSSEAHQDMLKLRDEMLEAIEKKYKEDKEKLDKERDEAATTIVDELEAFYRSPQIKRSYSSALPASLKTEADDANGEYIGPPPPESKTESGMDSLAELEMWRKINQSAVAMDYFLFIESFPNGQFTEIARQKMHYIGDPVWNAVRESHDPFKFRDFIKNNPDSPFLDVARSRMEAHAKTALEWEQLRESRDPSKLRAFEARHPGHTLSVESKRIRAQILWSTIENTSSVTAFKNFLSEFPESPQATKAKAILESLQQKPTVAPVTPAASVSSSDASLANQRSTSSHANRLARFSGTKFEVAKNAHIWSEFTFVAPCTVKISVYSTVVTYPIKDDLLLDLRSLASARAKKGRWWLTEVEHGTGKFDITRSTFTRNPAWGQVKESFPFSQKSLAIAAFRDEPEALELANEIGRLAAECKKP
jgi:hypothetical protein